MSVDQDGDATEEDERPIDLSILIPAYCEGVNLRDLLPQIEAAVAALTRNYEVLIVDTETAMDDTASVCAAHGVRHVHRRGGNRYGDAIRTGIEEAMGEYLLCMDGDGSHSPSYFASMWQQRGVCDIVIGSRYAQGGKSENPAVSIWMSYLVNIAFRVAFSIRAKDVTNSFRLYRRSCIATLRLESDDFDILEEILIKAVILTPPARIAEVPVIFARRNAGESKRKLVQFALGYVTTLRKLRRFRADARRDAKAGAEARS